MLTLQGVWKVYRIGAFGRREHTAVRDVSFQVRPGEVVSLIGESGSGKTTIGRMVLRLTPATRGRICFEGNDIAAHPGGRKEYYRRVQGVFQDPFSSFNPVFPADRVFTMVRQEHFGRIPEGQWRARVEQALADVRLDPGTVLGKYPHQLSGGQLQRILIARALLLDIKLLVADEIISMLDASTRIDVLNLLAELKARGLAVLFVTHDLALGNYISDQTVILHKGVVVERGVTDKVFADPRHPYARTLLASVPQLHRKWGPVPNRQESQRCLYHERYPGGDGDPPPMLEVAEGHYVGCFNAAEGGEGCAGA